MNKSIKIGISLVAISTLGTLAAFAAKPVGNDALITSHAKVSLTQAIQTAEHHVRGQAVRAELEASREGWIYDVEVVADGSPYDVAVDAVKGTVVAAAKDKTDTDDGHDKVD
jgi:uncharacterized membrane protein YkoI